MRERHCSSDELIAHLYGLKSADEHLDSCGECSARLRQAELRRTEAAEAPEVPDELLAAQRRSIYQRLGSPVAAWHPLRWAASGMAMFAIVLGLTLSYTRPAAHSRDDSFFVEISSLDQNPAPRAVQPIQALVEDDVPE
jgi:predicted anti-sigma-YlaC factor YlaD